MRLTPQLPTPTQLVAAMPFASTLGITVETARPDEVRGELPWAQSLCTINDVLHGGALMTLADSVGAICAYLNLPPHAATSTIQSNANFFRAVRSGTVRATCRPLHVGRTTIVVQTELRDDQHRTIGTVIQTQSVTRAD